MRLSFMIAFVASLKAECHEVFSEASPLFSVHVNMMMTPPMARKTAAASNGATGPRLQKNQADGLQCDSKIIVG